MMDLSVVLISRNQEWNIARLIGSVLKCVPCVISREIVLIDSASTDRTVDIACAYPISILRLKPEQPLTPSAGRWVGYKYSTGDHILFLDGDMELCNGWLERALSVMQTMPNVAVVSGPWITLPKTNQRDDTSCVEFARDEENGYSIEGANIGGAALYRRSVLRQVGPFNPYLYSDEEPELSIRIRHAGYNILSLNHPIAYHYSDPSEAISTLIQRWRRNLWLGMGQSIRYHLGDELFWPYVKERGYGCLPTIGLAVGIICIISSILSSNWFPLIIWSSLLILLVILESLRTRSPYRTLYSLIQRIFVVDGTIRGFFMKPMNAETFPDKHEIIQ
jgi:glycosyltransferase involved in cell wall biosynthesis